MLDILISIYLIIFITINYLFMFNLSNKMLLIACSILFALIIAFVGFINYNIHAKCAAQITKLEHERNALAMQHDVLISDYANAVAPSDVDGLVVLS